MQVRVGVVLADKVPVLGIWRGDIVLIRYMHTSTYNDDQKRKGSNNSTYYYYTFLECTSLFSYSV